jgi:hypothetical protein
MEYDQQNGFLPNEIAPGYLYHLLPVFSVRTVHPISTMPRRKIRRIKTLKSSSTQVEDDFLRKGEQMALSDEDAFLIESVRPKSQVHLEMNRRIRVFVHPRRKAA